MITGRDFIFTGLQPWDISMGSNARDIAIEIAKHNRVLYVNTPLSMFSSDLQSTDADVQQRLKVLHKQASPIRAIDKNIWLLDFPFTIMPVNSLPDGILFDIINKLNNKKIFTYINKIANELDFRDVIHFCDNNIYRSFYAKEYLNTNLNIYYRRDNLLGIKFWQRHATRLEPKLIAKSDLVVCNSTELTNFAKRYNKNSYDIGQGVDLSTYKISNDNKPTDIENISHPIIGYMGDITSVRLDADLIFNLAKANPNYSFVMVGRIDHVFATHQLNKLNNVYFLGSKAPNTVPDYINSFDICINPQSINQTTIGNY
ncbi:MAG: glycosyltransferase family 1 protein, partial [Rikenellaceae bacterium]